MIKSVSRGGKLVYKFKEEKNQQRENFTNKNQTQQVPRTIIRMQQV